MASVWLKEKVKSVDQIKETQQNSQCYTDIMENCRFSDSSLSCGLNSDPAMQASEGREGDLSNVMDSKSNMKPEASCNDYSLAAKPTRQCPFEVYLEKCTQLEKENLEVKKKLKKTEKYSKECKTELQIFVKRFKEFKNIIKDLDSKNKHLLIKNQQMRQRVTEVLKQNRPQCEDLARVTKCCEHHCQEKQQLRETVVLQEGVKNLTGPVESQLQQENQTLRERLDHNSQVIKDAESRVERVQQELDELECCLFTVQTERNLLRQEVKRLHKEYISLTNSISLQLKGNNKASGKPLDCPSGQSSPVQDPVDRRRHNITD